MADTKASERFAIPDEVQLKYPELVKLVLETESMDDNEKQYWFDTIPGMASEQIDRLFTIMDTEKTKLAALEAKYQEEIRNLNAAHLVEWQEFQLKSAKAAIANQFPSSAG